MIDLLKVTVSITLAVLFYFSNNTAASIAWCGIVLCEIEIISLRRQMKNKAIKDGTINNS